LNLGGTPPMPPAHGLRPRYPRSLPYETSETEHLTHGAVTLADLPLRIPLGLLR
jgi:hypothetical protein